MNGGRLIGKGSYGCIYKPALKCKGSDVRKDGVTKIMKRSYAIEELDSQKKVDEIDKDYEYHMNPPTICELGDYNEEADQNLEECELIPYEMSDEEIKENFVLLQLKYGGLSLHDFMRENKDLYKNMKKGKIMILQMKNLFKGLVEFDKHNFTHLDIKSQNILYDSNKNRFNYIDFGLSVMRKNITDKRKFILDAGYYALPFDTILSNYTDYRLVRESDKQHLTDEEFISYLYYVFNKKYSRGYMPFFDKKYIADGKSIYKQMYKNEDTLHKIHDDIQRMTRDEFIEETHKKIDVFSLGIVLIELFVFFTGEKYNISNVDDDLDDFYKELHNLIQKMTHPYFKERYNAEEAYMHFKEIYDRYNTKTKKIKITRKKIVPRVRSSNKSPRLSGTRKRHTNSEKEIKGKVKVRNPLTGRWINKNGKLSKKLGLNKK